MKRITTPQLLLLRIEIYFADIEIEREELIKWFCYIGNKYFYFSQSLIGEVCGKTSAYKKTSVISERISLQQEKALATLEGLIKDLNIK